MADHRIHNFDELATTRERSIALSIAEAGLAAIDTARVVQSSVLLDEASQKLRIMDVEIDLAKYRSIRVIGFGKASCDAGIALEKILRNRIHSGVVIDVKVTTCEIITSLEGTHPRPSEQNVGATRQLMDRTRDLTADDLVIVIVSGGGSSLLCWPEDECTQGQKLYTEFLSAGGNIEELNTVRRHLSLLKGGGLAKSLYPATVVGLVFCDVPGNHIKDVASGPTFKDSSTVEDAQAILDKYHLTGYQLSETPKDDRYFENVHNVCLVSNEHALRAMTDEAKTHGLSTEIMTTELYDDAQTSVEKFIARAASKRAVLAGGEIKLIIRGSGGSGGRCSYLALSALPHLTDKDLFIALASDGRDNSDSAGAIVDSSTLKKASDLGLDIADYTARFDSLNFFQKTGDVIMTGQTGANVSDILVWIRS